MAILGGRGDWDKMVGSAPIKRWRWELFAVFLRTSLKSRRSVLPSRQAAYNIWYGNRYEF